MPSEAETSGLFSVMGTLLEAGLLKLDDERRCRERLVRLGVRADAVPTSDQLRADFTKSLELTREGAVTAAEFAASPVGKAQAAQILSTAPHQPQLKRPRTESALNSAFN